MWAPIASQRDIQALQFIELPPYMFGERHALSRLPLQRWLQFRWQWRGKQSQRVIKDFDMYSTRSVNGFPAIQRDGQNVLSVCDRDWDFANWLCAVLNELGHMPTLLLSEQDQEWLKSIDGAFRRNVQHA